MARLLFIAQFGILIAAASDAEQPTSPGLALFRDHVRPTFEQKCTGCHNPDAKKGALDLTTREALLIGGKSGAAIDVKAPHSGKASMLYKLVAHEDEPPMPLKQPKLDDAVIQQIAEWIDAGAPYDGSLKVLQKSDPLKDGANFWSFQPLKRVDPPAVKNADWVKTPIDRFILAALEKKNLSPTAPADKRKLIRRVYFDLIGLPPTPSEIDAFLNDASPNAYDKLIDTLLANPHFGERWGRHWLDVARYADSCGYENDGDRPDIFHYRDFVIRAFNDDMPYDQFVKLQLAGDEFSPGDAAAHIATGFCACGPFLETKDGTAEEKEKWHYDWLDDMLTTTGASFLGLTVGCARCHDHKYDPIQTRDYYRMLAAFTPAKFDEIPLGPGIEDAHTQAEIAAHEEKMKSAKKQLDDWYAAMKKSSEFAAKENKILALNISDEDKSLLLPPIFPNNPRKKELLAQHAKALAINDNDLRGVLSGAEIQEWDRLKIELKKLEDSKPPSGPHAFVLSDSQSTPVASYLLERGDPSRKKEEVTLGFVTLLAKGKYQNAATAIARPANTTSTYQRATLAQWILDPKDGAGELAARVIVNRLWQHHFGEGLVRTPNDFGAQGERPTHPELLDWLAYDLIANGWKLKRLHKMILMSAAYVQDTAFDAAKSKIDPDNRLLWRRRPQRLEAEAVRDSILFVSGQLKLDLFGPAIKTPIPAEAVGGRNKDDKVKRPTADGPDQWRRTIYLFTKRSLPMPMIETLDAPSSSQSCGRRAQSTVAPQALIFLNDSFVRNQALLLAKRIETEKATMELRVTRLYLLALGREPSATEMETLLGYAKQDSKRFANLCQLVLGLNEFVYVD